VGSPFSLQNTVTTGIISTAHRSSLELGFKDPDMDYIQTDAIINYGNSGGPLVNLDGDVIGINTLKVAAGISFAIPVDRIRQFLADSHSRQVNGDGTFHLLSIMCSLIQDLRERDIKFPDVSSGVYIYEVIPGTAAYSAGMMDRDVIISINGQPIRTMQDVSNAMQSRPSLSVQVRREEADVTLMVIPTETD
uniref:Serine protease HTRA1-like n=1 Tax=Gouania willdenowi TaxID=441366 RepID=A0A8C5HPE7_GOUWI